MPVIAASSLAQSWMLIAGLTALLFIWLQWIAPRLEVSMNQASDRVRRWIGRAPSVILALVILIGLSRAWRLMWLGDDAFISFRYSQMFAEGEGLVFNTGEWVEGYTNFLWTWMLGVASMLGAPIPQTALIGDLVSFVGSVVMTAAICKHAQLRLLPAIVMASAYPCVVFATSGLETMPAVFFVLWGVHALCRERLTLSGLAFTLGALMRPDHLLFWGCGGLSLLWCDLAYRDGTLWRRLRWIRYLRYSLPLLMLYGGYMVWRVQAYGDWVPNTYYAKSGGLSYWTQGGVYLASFLLGAGVWWLLLSSLTRGIGHLIRRIRSAPHLSPAERDGGVIDEISSDASQPTALGVNSEEITTARRLLARFCGLSITIFGLYVVKVGGDFMLYRFFVVLVPLIWILYSFMSVQRWTDRLVLSLAFAFALTPVELIKYQKKRWKLAAEETFYHVDSLIPFKPTSRYVKVGRNLSLLSDLTPETLRVAIDCVGMVSFYGGDLKVFDLFGLTSPEIARKPLKRRGRPGHEKYGTLNDALRKKSQVSNVDLWRRAGYKKTKRYTSFKINTSRFYFLRYDSALYKLLKQLKDQGVKVKLPLTPKQAVIYAKLRAAKGPDKTLARFLKYFYARELKETPELQEVIKRLLKTKAEGKLKDQSKDDTQGRDSSSEKSTPTSKKTKESSARP